MLAAGLALGLGLGALGAEGPGHVIDLMIDEMKSAFGQVGAFHPEEARSVVVRPTTVELATSWKRIRKRSSSTLFRCAARCRR